MLTSHTRIISLWWVSSSITRFSKYPFVKRSCCQISKLTNYRDVMQSNCPLVNVPICHLNLSMGRYPLIKMLYFQDILLTKCPVVKSSPCRWNHLCSSNFSLWRCPIIRMSCCPIVQFCHSNLSCEFVQVYPTSSSDHFTLCQTFKRFNWRCLIKRNSNSLPKSDEPTNLILFEGATWVLLTYLPT